MAALSLPCRVGQLPQCCGLHKKDADAGSSRLRLKPGVFARSTLAQSQGWTQGRARALCGARTRSARAATKAVDSGSPVSTLEAVVPQGKVVVIDNYDSFTYNLCQYLGDLGCEYAVFRNDEITVDELERMAPRGILISPGPGTPEDSGISLEIVTRLGPSVPLFGVCMGLQCMGQAYGGRIVRAPGGVMHGKTSEIHHSQHEQEDGLLAGLPNPFTAARYHSLVIDRETFPASQLEITAWTSDGLIMGVRHLWYRHVEGVQFHPESIITKNGMQIVANFITSLELFEKQRSASH